MSEVFDSEGNELRVGDTIYYSHTTAYSSTLCKATIEDFTPQKIRIRDFKYSYPDRKWTRDQDNDMSLINKDSKRIVKLI